MNTVLDIATHEDFKAISEIIKMINCINCELYDSGLEIDELELLDSLERLKMILSDSQYGVCIVVRSDEIITGLVICYLNNDRGTIQDIWVDDNYRGTRQCSGLFDMAIKFFDSKGCRNVNCFTSVKNFDVQKMLSKRGFREISLKFQLDMEN